VGGPPDQLVLGVAALAQVDELADDVAGPPVAVEVEGLAARVGDQPGVAEHQIASPSTRRQRCWSW
jgi:hypothetical protein